jgi:rRNA-processing protein FCF1
VRIVLDTSAIIYIVEMKIDVLQLLGHEIYVPTAVLEELRALAAKNRKAGLALRLLPQLRPRIYERGGPADLAVLEAARELNAAVLAGDSEICKEARRRGIPVARFHKKQIVIT